MLENPELGNFMDVWVYRVGIRHRLLPGVLQYAGTPRRSRSITYAVKSLDRGLSSS